jgi:uncharacterized protein YjbI with pentapeptide repeats
MNKYYFFLLVFSVIISSVLLFKQNYSVSAQAVNTTPPAMCVACSLGNIGNRLMNKDLTDAYMPNAQLGNANLSGTIFTDAYIPTLSIESGAILDNAKFKNAYMESTYFGGHGTNINFKNAELNYTSFINVVYQNANFSNTTLYHSDLSGSDFSNSNMTGLISVDGANFSNVNLTNVNFTNANLNLAQNMGIANVTGVTWSNTTCPDGSNSNSNGNTCVGHF